MRKIRTLGRVKNYSLNINFYNRQLIKLIQDYIRGVVKDNKQIAYNHIDLSVINRYMRIIGSNYDRVFNKRVIEDLARDVVQRVSYDGNNQFKKALEKDFIIRPDSAYINVVQQKELAIRNNINAISGFSEHLNNRLSDLTLHELTHGRNITAGQIMDITGVSYRKAYNISRRNTLTTNEMLNTARALDLGLTEGTWRHSHGDKVPRPDHLAADGRIFNLKKGCLISGKYIQPTEEYGCTCYTDYIL